LFLSFYVRGMDNLLLYMEKRVSFRLDVNVLAQILTPRVRATPFSITWRTGRPWSRSRNTSDPVMHIQIYEALDLNRFWLSLELQH